MLIGSAERLAAQRKPLLHDANLVYERYSVSRLEAGHTTFLLLFWVLRNPLKDAAMRKHLRFA